MREHLERVGRYKPSRARRIFRGHFDEPGLRLILVAVAAQALPEQVHAARQEAEQIHAQLVAGKDFAALSAAAKQKGFKAVPLGVQANLSFDNTVTRALSHNVVLPAWMHMGSTVQNLGLAHVGDTLNVRAKVTKNYEHKGHKWVEIDALVVANETKPISRVTHIAIYRPRQLAEAA